MTRKEEIEDAAYKAFSLILPRGFNSDYLCKQLKDLRTAFKMGASWADEHPSVPFFITDSKIEDLDISEDD